MDLKIVKFIAMKIYQVFFLLAAFSLWTACASNKYATNGQSYEHDDVYFQPNETFISDFAIVDDPVAVNVDAPPAVTETPAVDEYYVQEEAPVEEETPSVSHNYYGNVYNYGGFGSGFNSYYYAGFNNGWYNPWQPGLNLVWDPYRGWHMSYHTNFGWGNYWNDPWGWNSPCYDPWSYNSWAWNSWNSPYGYYNPYGWNNPYCSYGNYWYNGFGNNYYDPFNNNGFGVANVTFGNRPSLTVGSQINSSYSNGQLNAGRLQRKPLIQTDAVTEIDRIKDDYHQTLANGNGVTSDNGKTGVNGYQHTVGTGATKPTVSKQPSIKHEDSPGIKKPQSTVPMQDGPDMNDRPIQSNDVERPRPQISSKPESRPNVDRTPSSKPATSPRSSAPSGGNKKPAPAPSSSPRKKEPQMSFTPANNQEQPNAPASESTSSKKEEVRVQRNPTPAWNERSTRPTTNAPSDQKPKREVKPNPAPSFERPVRSESRHSSTPKMESNKKEIPVKSNAPAKSNRK
jgi:hypothetical protein